MHKKYVDIKRRLQEFNVDDNVLLKLIPHIRKKINSKIVRRGLMPKYNGPFNVKKTIETVT